jgi:hypothetical protein
MGMQYETSDGKKFTEFFENLDQLKERKDVIERNGGKVHRIVRVYAGAKVKSNPRYPVPHQGAKEIEKHRKRLERQALKSA